MADGFMKLHDQQKGIKIGDKELCDETHYYQRTNLESRDSAMDKLDGNCYKLWHYLQGHKEGYVFALSPKELEKRGLKKHPYLRAVNILIEQGYLVPDEIKPGIQGYLFIEKPVDNFNRSDIGKKNDPILIPSGPVEILTPTGIENDPISVDKMTPDRSIISTRNIIDTITYNKDISDELSEEEKDIAKVKLDELLAIDPTLKTLFLEQKKTMSARERFNWVMSQ